MKEEEKTANERKLKDFLTNPTQEEFEHLKRDPFLLGLIASTERKDCLKFFSIEDWGFVWNTSSGDLKKFAQKKIMDTDATFDKWDSFRKNSSNGLREIVEKKMMDSAETFADWVTVYQSTSSLEKKNLAFKKMGEMTHTFEEWYNLYSRFRYYEKIGGLILKKMGEVKRTPAEWKTTFSHSDDHKLRQICLKKMGETAEKFAEWEFIYEHSSDELKELAFKKMSNLLKDEKVEDIPQTQSEKNEKTSSCLQRLCISFGNLFKRNKGTSLPLPLNEPTM
ncbi:MAG: hypothetical protein LBO09_07195 [Candidatus Peribacteria bacterium]|jgi:hypothetical protein|nr:hypothetical protein [Candidatus Peribacteria bacterium]